MPICFLGLGCNSISSDREKNGLTKAEARQLQSQLDSLDKIEDVGQRSVAIRTWFVAADAEVQQAAVNRLIQSTQNIMYYNSSADSGLIPFYRQLTVSKALGDKYQSTASLQLSSYYAHIVSDADSAVYYLNKAYKHQSILGDTINAKLYATAAQIYQLRGQLKDASDNLYKSITFYDKINDGAKAASSRGNLANVYRTMGDFQKSIELRKLALMYFNSTKDNQLRAVALGGLAADYADIQAYDSAKKYFIETEALFNQGIESPVAEYYLYLSKAGMFVSLKRYDSSSLYFDKAKELLPAFNDENQQMLFTIMSSIAYAHTRDVSKEATMIEQYIPKLLEQENLKTAKDAYYSLYSISQIQKTSLEPIEYYQLYDSLRTVLADDNNRQYVAEMESKYESQKKALTIAVQQRELERRKKINIILILSVVTVALAGGFLIARIQLLRSRKEANMQQSFTRSLLKNTEDERRRIAAELHDGISHELLTLKNNLELGTALAENRINAIIKDIRMISRNLHPVMLDQIGLEYSIQYLCDQVMNSGQMFASTDIDYHKQLSKEDELQLYRIIQESLTNALKYADAHAVKIIILTKEDELHVKIMDNGKGFDVAQTQLTKPAFGLNSMIQRGKSLGGDMTITSSDKGTTINLQIPVKKCGP